MAGTIIADYIRTDANKLSLNVGNTTFATINANGLFSNTGVQIISQNGQVATSALTGTIATGQIADLAVTGGKIAANTVTSDKFGSSGVILQAIHAYSSATASGAVGSWLDGVVTATITPLRSTSKIVAIYNLDNQYGPAGDAAYRALANGVDLMPTTGNSTYAGSNAWTNVQNCQSNRYQAHFSVSYSPGSTSAQTFSYKLFLISGSGTQYNNYPSDRGVHAITLFEVAA